MTKQLFCCDVCDVDVGHTEQDAIDHVYDKHNEECGTSDAMLKFYEKNIISTDENDPEEDAWEVEWGRVIWLSVWKACSEAAQKAYKED